MIAVSHRTRICSNCGQELPLDHFTRRRRGSEAREGRCRPCRAAYLRRYRAAQRSETLRRFVARLQSEQSVRRVAAMCNGMFLKFGGVDGFCRAWKAQIDAARPGSREALNAFWAVVAVAQLCNSDEP